jgi:hypothetical protein
MDFGSLWDPYAGVKSRSYLQDMEVAVVSADYAGVAT